MQISLQAKLDLLHIVNGVHFIGKKLFPQAKKTSTTVDDIAQHIAEK